MATHASRIFLSPPEVYQGEREALLEAFDSGWIAPVGPALKSFEEAFCKHMGSGYAVALSSGTAALHLSLLALDIKPGAEVFCSTMSFAASANAIRYVGARPVFIDSESESWNMDPALLEKALADRKKRQCLPAAVELVHAYGQCADIEAIFDLCRSYDVPVIEDAAEALGATYRGQPCGSFGCTAAFSFNGNKLITSSGGGMLWTREGALAERVRYLATQARLPNRGYLHEEVGYNYRLSNLLAALGEAQLKSLPERIRRRRAVFEKYQEGLSDLPAIQFMPEPGFGVSTRWLTCMTLQTDRPEQDRDAIMDALEAANIESRPLWRPLHCQPAYRDFDCYGGQFAELLAQGGLCLPSSGQLKHREQERVIEVIRQVLSD